MTIEGGSLVAYQGRPQYAATLSCIGNSLIAVSRCAWSRKDIEIVIGNGYISVMVNACLKTLDHLYLLRRNVFR